MKKIPKRTPSYTWSQVEPMWLKGEHVITRWEYVEALKAQNTKLLVVLRAIASGSPYTKQEMMELAAGAIVEATQ